MFNINNYQNRSSLTWDFQLEKELTLLVLNTRENPNNLILNLRSSDLDSINSNKNNKNMKINEEQDLKNKTMKEKRITDINFTNEITLKLFLPLIHSFIIEFTFIKRMSFFLRKWVLSKKKLRIVSSRLYYKYMPWNWIS